MKLLANYTNGIMVLSDSFATSILKQGFLRLFAKGDQVHLTMGFNATFDVQVSFFPNRFINALGLSLALDYEGIQSVQPHQSRNSKWQGICLCRQDRNRCQSNIHLENLRYLSMYCRSGLFPSRHPRRTTASIWFVRSHPICHALPAFIRAATSPHHDHCTQLC